MRRAVNDEGGFALVSVLMLVLLMLAFGIGVLSLVDTQQNVSGKERTRESSFNLAEAALGAQALQVSRRWPTAAAVPPAACTPTSTSTACPDPAAVSDGYTTADYATSCAGAATTPLWTTSVRDNVAGEQYWSTAVTSRASYDANADGSVWLRSTATVQCRRVSVVSLMSRSQVPLSFPNNVVTANWFRTTNQGRKVIIDTRGSASQPAGVVTRCAGLTTAQCQQYPSDKGQVQPPTVRTDSGGTTAALSPTQLALLEAQASAAGTLLTICPTTAAQLTSVNGAPVVVTAVNCNISIGANTVINSAASPGALIIENGTMSLGGGATFYGLLYLVNKQGANGVLLDVTGTASVQGLVAADGSGGVSLGASKANLVFDPRATSLLRGYSGANIDRNSFRTLPSSVP
jgi:Tfp pilus assembly protein PilX